MKGSLLFLDSKRSSSEIASKIRIHKINKSYVFKFVFWVLMKRQYLNKQNHQIQKQFF